MPLTETDGDNNGNSAMKERCKVSKGTDDDTVADSMATAAVAAATAAVDSNDSSNGTAIASIVNRYKMERKNVQQGSDDAKDVTGQINRPAVAADAVPSIQSYSSSIIQTILHQDSVRVKIADLGNACYEVIIYRADTYYYLSRREGHFFFHLVSSRFIPFDFAFQSESFSPTTFHFYVSFNFLNPFPSIYFNPINLISFIVIPYQYTFSILIPFQFILFQSFPIKNVP